MSLSTEIRSENPLGRAGTERLPRVCGSSAVPSSTRRGDRVPGLRPVPHAASGAAPSGRTFCGGVCGWSVVATSFTSLWRP